MTGFNVCQRKCQLWSKLLLWRKCQRDSTWLAVSPKVEVDFTLRLRLLPLTSARITDTGRRLLRYNQYFSGTDLSSGESTWKVLSMTVVHWRQRMMKVFGFGLSVFISWHSDTDRDDNRRRRSLTNRRQLLVIWQYYISWYSVLIFFNHQFPVKYS